MIKTIGIIGALDYEIELITKDIENKEVIEKAGRIFNKGNIKDKTIVSVVCGVGKVNAALCTQAMIDNFNPDIIINSGVSGSLSKEVKILDIVVADKLYQHDVDVTKFGYKLGQLPGLEKEYVETDIEISNKIYDIAKLESIENQIHKGAIATGDQYIADNDKKVSIIENFSAITVEMESAAIGQVCKINSVPFAILRTISDNAEESSTLEFDEFAKKAAITGSKIILKFIKKI